MLFNKVFGTDIVRLRSMEDMWKTRKPPEPLDYKVLMEKAADAIAARDAVLKDDQKVWSLEENLVVFNDSLDRLSKRSLELQRAQNGSGQDATIAFDKDDEDTLDFVAASANIRSALFGIDRKSKFDIKQMAGNIIPAIATTNAIVAGLCVLESFKVLKGEYDKAKEVFLTPFGPSRLLASDKSREPNPDCPVCSVFQTRVYVDLSRATLNDLVEDFLKLQMGYGDKEISIANEVGILYDPDETDNLDKKLVDLGKHRCPRCDGFLACLTLSYRHQAGFVPDYHRRGRRRPLRQCGGRNPRSVCLLSSSRSQFPLLILP
jgi:ubiquitin-like 1-activating enzyme E1 B